MGAVPGVGVVGEIRSATYQKGQIYNRPIKKQGDWLTFAVKHNVRWPKSLVDINYLLNDFGASLPINYPLGILPGGGIYPQISIPLAGKFQILELTAAEASMQSLVYDYQRASILGLEWDSRPISDQPDLILIGNRRVISTVGVSIASLLLALDTAKEYAVLIDSPAIIRLNNENPPEDDILNFLEPATLSVQVTDGFAGAIGWDEVYLPGAIENLYECQSFSSSTKQAFGSNGTFGTKTRHFGGFHFKIGSNGIENFAPLGISGVLDTADVPLPPWASAWTTNSAWAAVINGNCFPPP